VAPVTFGLYSILETKREDCPIQAIETSKLGIDDRRVSARAVAVDIFHKKSSYTRDFKFVAG
jgi:hypothetical protein